MEGDHYLNVTLPKLILSKLDYENKAGFMSSQQDAMNIVVFAPTII